MAALLFFVPGFAITVTFFVGFGVRGLKKGSWVLGLGSEERNRKQQDGKGEERVLVFQSTA
jgi:hypothetical protein